MTTNETFTKWLNKKLHDLNTDETIFGSYILSILEGEETEEEKQEALEGILQEILKDDIEDVIQSILKQWAECQIKITENIKRVKSLDVDAQLAKLMEVQKLEATIKEKQYTEEEKRIREQILAQYSEREVSDCEYEGGITDDDAHKQTTSSNHGLSGVERNTNVQDVLALQKERREQARLEAAAKKQKDKEDRERQKQLREEKKEKRKTVKGERRR